MKYFLVILLVLAFLGINAQPNQPVYNSKSKKAIKKYEDGIAKYKSRDYQGAVDAWTSSTLEDTTFLEPHIKLGMLAKAERKEELARKYLEVVVRHAKDTVKYQQFYYELADTYFSLGYFDQSCKLFTLCSTFDFDSKTTSKIEQNMLRCNMLAESAKKNSNLKPQKLGEPLNKFSNQYFPSITLDEEQLYFTKREGLNEDLFYSKKVNGAWGEPQPVSANINTANNEGTCAISGDGKTLVFTGCNLKGGFGACDLYVSYKTGEEWSVPENLGEMINTMSWESQPSLSPDGRTLYFASTRAGGYGKIDIWRATKGEDDKWRQPVNLGTGINTNQDDLSPFIHPNGITLFFASGGHLGFGGTDLFYSNFENGKWTKPDNLGYPINSRTDEASIIITPSAKKAYYTQDVRTTGAGYNTTRSILFEIDLPHHVVIPSKTTYAKGTVYDAVTKSKLQADIEVINVKTNEKIYKATSDPVTGEYIISLSEGNEYAFFVQKEGYIYKSIKFDIPQNADLKSKNFDIYLDPVKLGAKLVLQNIYFETNSYALDERSKAELEKIAQFLKKNPKQKIEISGHTDDVGDDKANMELSLKRATSVVEYLVKNGIETARLSPKGFGKTTPIVQNTSDENRALNRRIEMKIL